MILIEPKVEIVEQEYSTDLKTMLIQMFRHIELTTRVSYKSEDKMTDTSYQTFIPMLLKKGHTAVFEQGTLYFKNHKFWLGPENLSIYAQSGWTDNEYISLNFRAILDIDYKFAGRLMSIAGIPNELDSLGYVYEMPILPDNIPNSIRRVTTKWITDIGIGREVMRHRVFSFVQESTRYVNYSKEKFGGEVPFCRPFRFESELKEGFYRYASYQDNTVLYYGDNESKELLVTEEAAEFIYSIDKAENSYLRKIKKGWTAEDARGTLPLWTKTEFYMTGSVYDWAREDTVPYRDDLDKKGFFVLRTDKAAHKDIRPLAINLKEQFIQKGLVL